MKGPRSTRLWAGPTPRLWLVAYQLVACSLSACSLRLVAWCVLAGGALPEIYYRYSVAPSSERVLGFFLLVDHGHCLAQVELRISARFRISVHHKLYF